MIDCEFADQPRVIYGDMVFLRICSECGRFVKADKTLKYRENMEGQIKFVDANGTCKRCGRIMMVWEGYAGG